MELFKIRLKKAMEDLNLTQRQVCGLTGKSQASVSQYLSGTQVPPDKVLHQMAEAMGLDPEYFTRPDPPEETKKQIIPKRQGAMRRASVAQISERMGVHRSVIEKGLRQGVFPWGYAVHTTERSWAYIINADRFENIEGVEV